MPTTLNTLPNIPPQAIVNTSAAFDKHLNVTHFRVLIYLSGRANHNKNSTAWPSAMTVATELNLNVDYIRRCIRELVAFGYLLPVGNTPSGVVVYKVVQAVIRNETITNPVPWSVGGAAVVWQDLGGGGQDLESRGDCTWGVLHNKERNKEKEQPQPLSPTEVESEKAVVVVSSPSAKDETKPAKPVITHPKLSEPEAMVVTRMLATLPLSDSDALRAEFLARLDTGTIEKPVGYCASLVRVIKNGLFVPSASRDAAQRKEAEERKHREMEEARRVDAEERRQRAAMSDKDLEAERAKQKAFIAEALAVIAGKRKAL